MSFTSPLITQAGLNQDQLSVSNNSVGSDFPSYGLIKISDGQYEDLDPRDLSPFQTTNDKHKGRDTNVNSNMSRSKADPSTESQQISFSANGITTSLKEDIYSGRVKNEYDDLGHNRQFEINETLSREQSASNIPTGGIDQSRQVLERIIESYHSQEGAFLNKSVFLSNRMYTNQETVVNGSVKISIIQEINELLRKFIPSSSGELSPPSLTSIQSTIEYYEKLMTAFNILNGDLSEDQSYNGANTTTDPTLTSPKKSIYRTDSIDSKGSQASDPSIMSQARKPALRPSTNTSVASSIKPSHKRSDSLFLDKIKSRIKPSKHGPSSSSSSSSPSSAHLAPPVTPRNKRVSIQESDDLLKKSLSNSALSVAASHSRSHSLSTITTYASSSRSVKDQASIADYFQALDFLLKTIIEIQDFYKGDVDSDVCNRLDLVITFERQYILKFLLMDVSGLLFKFMRKYIQELI